MTDELKRSHQPAGAALRLRPIALPPEHGSWGLVLEPIALGLLVAPSPAGVCLAVGAFAAFLVRRPLKVALAEWGQPRSPRLRAAGVFILLYGTAALLASAVAAWLAGGRPFVPLAIVLPLGAAFALYDLRNRSRSWQAEFAGATAFALVATGMALADGWPPEPAWALAVVLAGRTIPSVLYVRMRIRRDRGRPSDPRPMLAAHVAAGVVAAVLVWDGLLPALVMVAFAALLIRAVAGVTWWRQPVPVKTIGWVEMALGVLTVAAAAIGYRLPH